MHYRPDKEPELRNFVEITATMSRIIPILLVLAVIFGMSSCKPDDPVDNGDDIPKDWVYNPTFFNLEIPAGFPPPNLPQENPLTREGVKLGRMLFYDPILSGDSTMSCASCHNQNFAFTDSGNKFSTGIDGLQGTRNAMPIFNLAWSNQFFWDGRALGLEEQAQLPVTDPLEMHATWSDNLDKLRRHADYPRLFYEAFEVKPEDISPSLAGKAMEQFMLTIISDESKFDKYYRREFLTNPQYELTALERDGARLFVDTEGGDCFHCHGSPGENGVGGNILFMDLNPTLQFRNNGLSPANGPQDYPDPGVGGITGNPNDYGKFKIPSLRNVELTAPYMHDGRFQTLEEVLDFYSTGVHNNYNVDPGMEFAYQNGVNMTQYEKDAILAFLKTLTDPELATNPDYSNPFE